MAHKPKRGGASSSGPSEARFALRAHHSAPECAGVPQPSLSMIANAREARSRNRLPESLPPAPTVEAAPAAGDNTAELENSLKRLLGIQLS